MQIVRRLLLISLLSVVSRNAWADCEQICYPGLPCPATEIGTEQTIAGDLCAGDLVLADGARLILKGGVPHLINVERSLKVTGTVEIVVAPCVERRSNQGKAHSPKAENPYDRGPHSSGRGDATAGRNGPDGEDGANGAHGASGDDAPPFRLAFAEFAGGKLVICAKGGDGKPGQHGGDGADGGDGEQGGRGIPGQPFGCGDGPGQGGNGGKGGNAGRGGDAGSGGAGLVTLVVPADSESAVNDLLSERIKIDISGGRPGAKGLAGKPGHGGHFGYGGRGSTGCSGREQERKGKDGADGETSADGKDGKNGADGKVVVTHDG